jgi:hypothetical protein
MPARKTTVTIEGAGAKRTKTTKTEQLPPAPAVEESPAVRAFSALQQAATELRNAKAGEAAAYAAHQGARDARYTARDNYQRAMDELDIVLTGTSDASYSMDPRRH